MTHAHVSELQELINGYTVTSSHGGLTARATANSPSVAITGLTIGTSYTFTVHATNDGGNGPESAPSNAVTPTPVSEPSPPVTPAAAPLNGEAWVSCTAPFDDGGSAITSYTVTAEPGDITTSGSSCPMLVQGLTNGVAYTFTITATNAAGGTSQPSQVTSPVTPHVPSPGPPPANDDFFNAQMITRTSGSVTGSNINATVEPGEPTIQDNGGGASVWYSWTVPADGTYTFDTCTAYPGDDGEIEAWLSNVADITGVGPGPSPDLCPAGEAGSTIIFYAQTGTPLEINYDGIDYRDGNGPEEGVFILEWSMTSS